MTSASASPPRPAEPTGRVTPPAPLHHFTVDVEEYFQVSALEPFVSRARWDAMPSRVAGSVSRLLDLLDEHDATGTFFVLGWVAERDPSLVRRIADAGHEVASHGWDHRRVTHQVPREFRESVRRSKALLEGIAGAPVLGFRAPSFSIVPGREWALDVLVEEGYRYDSSLFPVRRSGYGYPGGERAPHGIDRPGGRLEEFPPSTLRLGRTNLPSAGGAYFRLFPYAWTRAALRDAASRGAPGMFYLHPWEIDPEQPRVSAPWPTRVRHYGGLARTAGKLRRLLSEFRFQSVAATLAAHA